MEISLWVPLSKLHVFGIVPQNEQTAEVGSEQKEELNSPSVSEKTEFDRLEDEWDSKAMFIYDTWNNAQVSDANELYKNNRKEIFNDAETVDDNTLLAKVAVKRADLKNMLEIPSLYGEESIQKVINQINGRYNQMLELTEITLGVSYGSPQTKTISK